MIGADAELFSTYHHQYQKHPSCSPHVCIINTFIDKTQKNTELFSFSVFIEDKHNKYFLQNVQHINAENWTR